MESESKEPLAVRKYAGDNDNNNNNNDYGLANHIDSGKKTIENPANGKKFETGNSQDSAEANDDYNNDRVNIDDNSEATTTPLASKSENKAAKNNINTNTNNNSNKGKITHRSQSSPSSLTTHKFGLRPTPSPPRLIIDHKTGDIIESYPEQPVYLKTYQPLEDDDDDDDDSQADDCTFDDSLAHPYPPPLSNQGQLEEYNRLLAEQYGSSGPHHHQQIGAGGAYISGEELEAAMSNRNNSYRPAIPPPHSANHNNKVYFAPPVSSAGHLLGGNQPYTNHQLPHQMTDPFDSDQQQPYRRPQQQLAGGAGHPATRQATTSGQQQEQYQEPPHHQISGSHNNSFKRALNKLNEAANTDIAIMTDLPGAEYGGQPAGGAPRAPVANSGGRSTSRVGSSPLASGAGSNFKVTATSASKGKALLAAQGQQQQQLKTQPTQKQQQPQPQPHRIVPAIEDFNLYDFCFNFRTLLACLLSSLIIYLLAYPLSLDCTHYRPTYTYISIIVSSVNLICIVIFTLFWYCNGVTRTLYANLSSSAFIITIYSILVAINLALAILFFFINTCHFQRLIKTSSTPLIVAIEPPLTPTTSPPNIDLDQPMAMPLLMRLDNGDDGGGGVGMAAYGAAAATLTNIYAAAPPGKGAVRHSSADDSIKNFNTPLHRQPPPYKLLMDSSGSSVLGSPLKRRRRHWDEEDSSTGSGGEGAGSGQDQVRSLDGNSLGAGYPMEPLALPPGPPLASPPTAAIDYYSESPVEVAWEYLKEQAATFKRKFNQFLQQYDLRFIGALHALCAICLQYMAMKVAVVRSYFCSPVRAYI